MSSVIENGTADYLTTPKQLWSAETQSYFQQNGDLENWRYCTTENLLI